MSDMKFDVTVVGSTEVARALLRFPQKFGRTMLSLVKQEARGLAVELARNTKPYGFADKAKKRGEVAIHRDIRRVFITPAMAFATVRKTDPIAADKFWAASANHRFAAARKAIQASSSPLSQIQLGRLDPSLHQHARTGYGNVSKGQKPLQVVTNTKVLDTYAARIMKRVGFAKGSWINAAKSLGGRVRGVPQWASRHKQASGRATISTGDNPYATLTSNLDYIEDVLSSKGEQIALRVSNARLRKAIATAIGKIRPKGRG